MFWERVRSAAEQNPEATPIKGQWFTTTHWSVVLGAADSSSPGAPETFFCPVAQN